MTHVTFLLGIVIALAGIAMWSIPLALVAAGTMLAAASWLAYIGQRGSAVPAEQDGHP